MSMNSPGWWCDRTLPVSTSIGGIVGLSLALFLDGKPSVVLFKTARLRHVFLRIDVTELAPDALTAFFKK
jgi:hypothetical protein